MRGEMCDKRHAATKIVYIRKKLTLIHQIVDSIYISEQLRLVYGQICNNVFVDMLCCKRFLIKFYYHCLEHVSDKV